MNLQLQNTYQLGPSMIQSPPLRHPLIVERSLSGMLNWTAVGTNAKTCCRYLNGSILIATLQPSFTIQHTLTTTRAPSRITGLSWHGSSSKQKTDMLATQTLDGDLRVWSVPKQPSHEAPTIIRVLHRAEYQYPGHCWFAWSKNGRIVQHADG